MNWNKLETFVMIQSPWLTLIGEKWQDEQKNIDILSDSFFFS